MKNVLSLLALWGKAFVVFAAVVFVIATVQQLDEIDVGPVVWSPR
ncbi:hypothetical protein [Paraburkholderia caballeronis]|uniref:Uncharacterized protein n=1 Tax=Paraburkholderia caballeronis TaxID=416943 RepID=A0A1H7KZZ7_9BURK|nr:hypothetical protein [Paraburkholderia caballeronis]PXW28227.1 hypothetical protein C7403_102119 [Paraburkholderia caballeronis]PXX03593.1 hypothetical protein C7407_102119 [Paraburkholderia caballeronis]RAK04337.1 hypothetical protein C7409_102119 [Paraburkholderia caballeronis]SED84270.1 hypothetical protein SAMN05445871_4060 [Paraburkholderia caballeronis]SEK92036.1 hypothetical protein SAMN05192542_104119 [Paraburkholderia caballeronis]